MTGSYVRTDVYLNGTLVAPDQVCGVGTNLTLPKGGSGAQLKGILGLAYPALADYTLRNGATINYDPVVTTAMKHNKNIKLFSLAMDKRGGTLAFGGYPPQVSIDGGFVYTPIIPTVFPWNNTDHNSKKLAFYTIKFGFLFDGANKIPGNSNDHALNHFVGIIDSGTSLTFVPARVASAVGALFKPPGKPDSAGLWHQVDCNAKPPVFGLIIEGHAFSIPPGEMIIPGEGGRCWSVVVGYAVEAPVDDKLIIGQPFMRQVVTVFDVDQTRLAFAKKKA
jgi:hypothetical protein